MENYTCPIQLLSSGLHIVDSNGVHRDDTIYEITNICGELDNQKLLYIDVYDDRTLVTTRFYNSTDFILMYRSRIEEAFHHPLNMEVTVVATKDIVQADIIYPESQIVPRTQCSLQNIAANNSGSEIVPSVQSYTMNTQNIMANLVHANPGKPAKKESSPNAAIEAQKFLNCKRIITCKGGIYFYTGKYYKMLDKASLHKIICSVLYEDITEN